MDTQTRPSGLHSTALHPPEEIARGLFETGRRVVRTYPLASDSLLALALLTLSTLWLVGTHFGGLRTGLLQTAMIVPVAARRISPSGTFLITSAVGFVQWVLGYTLVGDAALLIGLYTIAAHESRLRALLAAGLLEVGALMAAIRWEPAGSVTRSFLFLSTSVIAALFTGFAAASGSRYLTWMDERARRLELERDHQGALAAAAERTRIAREIHDVVSHSLSVVITLADAGAVVNRSHPERGQESLTEISEVGRQALSDMRSMLGLLHTDEPVELKPQPGTIQIEELVERVRAAGLDVNITVKGMVFPLSAAAELTVFRIIQESLTNTLRHASAQRVWITISHEAPILRVSVIDDGIVSASSGDTGYGIRGMCERAALYDGDVRAGPMPGGGWSVITTLHLDRPETAEMMPR